MATSAVMQSVVASPLTHVTNKAAFHQTVLSSYVPRQCSSTLQVRCMAEDGQNKEVNPSTAPPPLPKPSPPTPKVSTNLFDMLAFSGPAPERINGRLALIGFVAAMAVEASKRPGHVCPTVGCRGSWGLACC